MGEPVQTVRSITEDLPTSEMGRREGGSMYDGAEKESD